MPARTVLAIDIGGTKLAAGVVDDAGRVLDRAEVPTPREGDAEHDAHDEQPLPELHGDAFDGGRRVPQTPRLSSRGCAAGCDGRSSRAPL